MTQAKRLLALLVAGSMLMVTACTTKPAAAPETSGEPIKIGLSAAITGPSAELGKGIEMGARLAVKEINDKGGVLGRKLELVVRDDQSNTQLALNAVNEMIQKEQVAAIIGPTNSGVVKATLGATKAAGIPHLINNGQDTEFGLDYPHAFQFAMPNRTQARMLVEFVKKRGMKKPGILNGNDGYGKPGAEDVKKELQAANITPVAQEEFTPKDADMTAQLLRLKDKGADVILLWGLHNDAATIRKNLKTLGWDVPLVGPNPLVMAAYRDLAGAEARNTYTSYLKTFITANRTAEATKFEKAWKAAYPDDKLFYGSGEKAHFYLAMPAQTYDAIYVLADAMKRANSTDYAKVLEALTATKGFKGVNSTITFSKEKRVALPDEANILVEVKPDGISEMK